MNAHRVVFSAADEVEIKEFDFDASRLGDEEVAIRTNTSLISPGTELACLHGSETWAPFPSMPGYAGCGEIIGVGSRVTGFQPGDEVFAYTSHASHVKAGALCARMPDGLDPKLGVFARMASVAITALRVSEAELGDTVAVTGLGLVGNLAAQLFAMAGCEVIGIDLSHRRREIARQCGVRHVLDASEDVAARVREITGGSLCATVVEATGIPSVAEKSASLAGKLGEVILLGSPRGKHQADLTDFMNQIHLWGKCVTFKGAHEWRFPVQKDDSGHAKHSLQRNIEILLRLIAEGRLQIAPLLTHVLPPSECVAAYSGLRDRKDEYLGVVFDWTSGV